jgi:hypothetical protein
LGYLTTSEEEVEITPPASPVKKFVEWFHSFLCLGRFQFNLTLGTFLALSRSTEYWKYCNFLEIF